MKILSDFNTGEALDVLAQITQPFLNIVSDPKIKSSLKSNLKTNSKVTAIELLQTRTTKIASILQVILKEKKEDLFAILSPFFEKTPEEIEKLSVFETFTGIEKLKNDKLLIDFLSSRQELKA